MHICFISSELRPYAFSGGLGDFSASLPVAMVDKFTQVKYSRILPFYNAVRDYEGMEFELFSRFDIHSADTVYNVGVMSIKGSSLKLNHYFIDIPGLFDRDSLYGDEFGDFKDNNERFTIFCLAVLRFAGQLDADILHLNDWQSGFVAFFNRIMQYKKGKLFKTLFTIHNLGYQGNFDFDILKYMPTGSHGYTNPEGIEFYGNISMLKSGIVYSDAINTVSPSYAREILTKEYGFGMEPVLLSRKDDLSGILNGADYKEWDPANDSMIATTYTADNLHGKKISKELLQWEAGLPVEPNVPLIAVAGRMVWQKGLERIIDVFESLMQRNLQFVILGAGDEKYQDFFNYAAVNYPAKVSAFIKFSNKLAHMIEAGADLFLMPSIYEPCGLNQIYSMRYGTLPVVSNTGGLRDTVKGYENYSKNATGFIINNPDSPVSLLNTLDNALACYKDKALWGKLVANAMKEDFSWNKSANEYMKLYKKILKI